MAKKEKNNYLTEKVKFYAFKDNDKYSDDIIAGVNGKQWRIQRGAEVEIPRYVFNALQNSLKQDTYAAKFISENESK